MITRPRRFGKTLSLSMLEHFFSREVDEIEIENLFACEGNKNLFANLAISKQGNNYLKHQAKYPVIFISFKDVKYKNFNLAYNKITSLLSNVYRKFYYLLNSDRLVEYDKIKFHKIIKCESDYIEITEALRDLSYYLYLHHKIKPILLIDEYDTPVQNAYIHKYYDEMIELIKGMLGTALKDGDYITKSVMAGILRVAKESLFSGLNNLMTYSVLDDKYSNYFGFNEEEVKEIIRLSDLGLEYEKVKEWYNGYRIGNNTVYNPWSIINLIEKNGIFGYYWLNTSGNDLLKELIIKSPIYFKEKIQFLLNGEEVTEIIDDQIVFSDLEAIKEKSLWSLLVMSGYLNATAKELTPRGSKCIIAIPNKEVISIYMQIIESWLTKDFSTNWQDKFINNLLTANIDAFREQLSEIIVNIASVHDMAKEPEDFYHGIILGITTSLYNNPHYTLSSNRES